MDTEKLGRASGKVKGEKASSRFESRRPPGRGNVAFLVRYLQARRFKGSRYSAAIP
jgi:hypothetical protein